MEAASDVALLGEAHRAQAASVLARAFFDDPGYVYIFPDEAVRRAGLDFVYSRVVDMSEPLGATFALRAGSVGDVVGVAAWIPAGAVIHPMQLVRHGLLRMPFRFGVGASLRLLECFTFMERTRAALMGKRRHWFLDHLGIEPGAQGAGYGTQLISNTMSALAARESLPCMLFTAKERNVPFYAKAGFAVRREDVVGGSGGFRMWSMVREG